MLHLPPDLFKTQDDLSKKPVGGLPAGERRRIESGGAAGAERGGD